MSKSSKSSGERRASSVQSAPSTEASAATSARERLQPPSPLSGSRRLWLLLATAGGLGLSPLAPGTIGALGGLGLYLALVLLLAIGGAPGPALAVAVLALCGLLLFWLGVRAADVAEAHYARHDDGRVVIDEVVGQLLALLPLPLLAPGRARDPLLLAVAFAAFRLFDIWKPGAVRSAERGFEGGLGVMLDDVVAALLAAGVLSAALLVGRLA